MTPLPGPNPVTPPLPAGGVRRTSSVDMVWTDVRDPTALDADGVAVWLRSVVSDPSGAHAVVCGVGRDRSLVRLVVDGRDATQGLEGRFLGAGFRSAVPEQLPGLAGTALGAALDDLPVAMLISMYAIQRVGAIDAADEEGQAMAARHVDQGEINKRAVAHMRDMCAGWALGGAALAIMERGEPMPLQEVPPAPPPGDGWHPMAALPPHAMRRHRRTDVHPDGTVDAMFRDVFVEPDGTPIVLHEYDLRARVDGERVVDAEAHPRVLPFTDCRGAARTAGLLRGLPIAEVSRATHKRTIGSTGCTHLTDCLRQLEAVPFLASLAG